MYLMSSPFTTLLAISGLADKTPSNVWQKYPPVWSAFNSPGSAAAITSMVASRKAAKI
jgi:hypothetical protein